ncbi:MAG: tRNA (guanosine(46)-N7)-methyltransferase TrmB [Pirellulales bacterium]|nr:tRNA (guanosine(46)-N7)-methyltransferase TrmB [Pirellulales bacterium]
MGRRALRPIDPALDLSRHFFCFDELPRPFSAEQIFPIGHANNSLGAEELFALEELESIASRPLEIDVGCGKGMYIAGAAAAEPAKNFIGVELRGKYARYTASRLARRDLANAVSVQADAERFFREDLSAGSIDAVHVYFPDPWWKARHKKRRIMNPQFVSLVENVLKQDGRLHFWTDVEEYFHVGVETVTASTQLQGPFEVAEAEPQHDLDYRTNFERRKRMLGLPIYRSEFRKQS